MVVSPSVPPVAGAEKLEAVAVEVLPPPCDCCPAVARGCDAASEA